MVKVKTMNSIGLQEAKSRLSELVVKASKGERFTITKRGVPIAQIVPMQTINYQEERAKAVHEIRRLRKDVTLGDLTIKELVEEGRKV